MPSIMTQASLLLNLVVLVPVCFGIAFSKPWVLRTYGTFQDGLKILLAVYLTIFIFSGYLLLFPHQHFILFLLIFQIVYKFLSSLVVKNFSNPVVVSNLLIAAFHTLTVFLLLQKSLGTIFS